MYISQEIQEKIRLVSEATPDELSEAIVIVRRRRLSAQLIHVPEALQCLGYGDEKCSSILRDLQARFDALPNN